MFLGLLRRRAEWKAAIADNARRLIEAFTNPPISRRANGSGAAGSMADVRRAIGPWSSSRSLGAQGLRLASPAPTCADKISAERSVEYPR